MRHAATLPLQVSGFAIPAGNPLTQLRLRLDRASLTGSWYEQQWRQLIAPLHEAGVPWAAILGERRWRQRTARAPSCWACCCMLRGALVQSGL